MATRSSPVIAESAPANSPTTTERIATSTRSLILSPRRPEAISMTIAIISSAAGSTPSVAATASPLPVAESSSPAMRPMTAS